MNPRWPLPSQVAAASEGAAQKAVQAGAVWLGLCPLPAERRQVARALRWVGAPHVLSLGVPLAGLSRSACTGLGALGLYAKAPLGVDVEPLPPAAAWHGAPDDALASALHADDGVCHAAQALAVWVRKEAVLKALGVGLACDPASFAVGPHAEGWSDVRVGAWGRVWLCSGRLPADPRTGAAGWLVAVAVQGERPADPPQRARLAATL